MESAVILDIKCSRAFAGAALDAGKVTIRDRESLNETSRTKMDFLKFLLDHQATNRLKPLVLEMALIFDKVHLFGLPKRFDFEKLKREGLVGVTLPSVPIIKGLTTIPEDFLRMFKPWIIRSIHNRTNAALKLMELPTVSYKAMSRVYDLTSVLSHHNVNFWKIQQAFIELAEVEPKLDRVSNRNLQLMAQMGDALRRSKLLHESSMIPCILGALADIMDHWTLAVMSQGASLPFLTRTLRYAGSDHATPERLRTVFQMCQIEIRNELEYAPVVQTVDDLLRLRNHKTIVRFRELLFEWCRQLPAGEEQVLRKIRSDLRKANKEIQRLEKWKKVDRWLFWAQLPTMWIPLLSTLVTVASFTTGLAIQSTESRHSWVAIGR